MFKLPFEWMPGSWGLKGKTRAIAQAEYLYTGLELELALLDIEYPEDCFDKQKKLIELKFRHEIYDEYTRDQELAKISELNVLDKNTSKIAELDIDLRYGKLTQVQYDRARADVLEEPWVSMPKIHWDPANSGKTYFELDYNDYFLDQLRENGYEGTDDDIINIWLNDICISITEEVTGLEGEFATPSRRTPDLPVE